MKTEPAIAIHDMSDSALANWIARRQWPADDSKRIPFGGRWIPENTLMAAWKLQRQSRDMLAIY